MIAKRFGRFPADDQVGLERRGARNRHVAWVRRERAGGRPGRADVRAGSGNRWRWRWRCVHHVVAGRVPGRPVLGAVGGRADLLELSVGRDPALVSEAEGRPRREPGGSGPRGGVPDNQVFTIVGDSATENPGPGLNTYPTSISVQQGDVIGFYTPPVGHVVTSPPDPAYRVGALAPPSDGPPGSNQNFFIGQSGSPPVQLDVSAQLEPDCDRDGLGDETQDTDLKSCPPGRPSASRSSRRTRSRPRRRRPR